MDISFNSMHDKPQHNTQITSRPLPLFVDILNEITKIRPEYIKNLSAFCRHFTLNHDSAKLEAAVNKQSP